jgi:3-methyl-2-oxobutanoate hydroxymethyltransferase
MLRDAKALEAAGAFAIVLELVTEPIADAISKELSIPTIGIGAGRGCDGQVLVFHDILQYSSPYREKRFVKTYADIGTTIRNAIGAYVSDVKSGAFPEEKHSFQLEPGTIVIPNLYGSGTTQEVEATEQEREQTT